MRAHLRVWRVFCENLRSGDSRLIAVACKFLYASNNPFSIATLLYLATAGGAKVCGIEKQVGSFGLGKSFDALLVNVGEDNLNPAVWGTATPRHVELKEKKQIVNDWLERFMHGGDNRNIEKVYVQGRFVGGRRFQVE